MERESAQSARAQIELLAASREQTLERIVLPWRHVIGWALFANGFILPTVLPIVLSEGWTLLTMLAFLAGGAVLLVLTSRSRESRGVKGARFRVRGEWILPLLFMSGLGAAFALALHAASKDDPWLGAAAVLLNSASYLVVYGGVGFLLRRQFSRLT